MIDLLLMLALGVFSFLWGRRVGRKHERERVQDQIYRLYSEGRVSASLRILSIRLGGLPDYDEPVLTLRDQSE